MKKGKLDSSYCLCNSRSVNYESKNNHLQKQPNKQLSTKGNWLT